MRDQIYVKIEGVEQAVFNFKQLEKQKQEDAQKELKKSAQIIKKKARANIMAQALQRTGDLYKRVRTRKIDKYSFQVYVPNKVFYSRFVEMGTKTSKAHPYLRPAYDIEKPKLMTKLAAMLKKGG